MGASGPRGSERFWGLRGWGGGGKSGGAGGGGRAVRLKYTTTGSQSVDRPRGPIEEACHGLGGPGLPFWAFSLHPLQKSKNQKIRKSKNGALDQQCAY